MVFQQFNLFPHLSVLENCTIAQTTVLKRSRDEAEAKARENFDLAMHGGRREVHHRGDLADRWCRLKWLGLPHPEHEQDASAGVVPALLGPHHQLLIFWTPDTSSSIVSARP